MICHHCSRPRMSVAKSKLIDRILALTDEEAERIAHDADAFDTLDHRVMHDALVALDKAIDGSGP